MAPEKRTELIAVRLGPQELQMLTELAEADGAYQSHVIRLLIRQAYAARFGAPPAKPRARRANKK
jgi:hypothetical protein